MPLYKPDTMLLWELSKTVKYGFAKTKLEHAIEYLEEVHERERLASGSHGFILYVDSYEGPSGLPNHPLS